MRKMYWLAILVLAAMLPLAASAQDYPTRDIRVICGFPAGSGADVFVRFFADQMKSFTDKPVIVENKPGALSVIGAEYVARAKPDGYTVFLTGATPITSGIYLFRKLNYDPVRDFQPITTMLWQPVILTVSHKSPVNNVRDLISLVRAKGDKSTYGGPATSSIATAEIFKSMTNLVSLQVSYKDSAPAVLDMNDGTLDFMFLDPVSAMENYRSGRVKAIAVTTPQRVSSAPEIPTMAESGVPGYDWTSWWAALVPAGTPQPIVNTLNGWFKELLARPVTKDFLGKFAAEPWYGSPEQARAKQLDEIEKWKEIARIAKFEPQ
jgi:tripartite-type tricarboxylate transporter receptor subunit TctC